MKFTVTLKEALAVIVFVTVIGSTWSVTIYKVDRLEHEVLKINGTLQWIIAEGILDGRYKNPPRPWIEPRP